MPTIIAFETAEGVVVAADRTVVRGNTVSSTSTDRTLDFQDCGGAVVDDPDHVRRELDAKLRAYRTDHGESPTIQPLTRLVQDVAKDVGTDAVVGARDESGHAQLRAVYADGSVLEEPPLALGTGAELALGRLEGAGPADMEAGESFAREVLEGVAQRDTRTGDEHDVWTLADG